jgi:hypothetical protein
MNNPITIKIESNIDITDEHKNELREKLVYAFIEQLRKSGMYKVTEEKDGYAWILRADLILPKKHETEPVKYGRWVRKHNSFPQRYFCTECGGGDVGRFAFCHHCGARMRMDGGGE